MSDMKKWLHHIYWPLGASLAVTFVDGSMNADMGFIETFLHWLVMISVIWLVFLPTTTAINNLTYKYKLRVQMRLILAGVVGCFPLAVFLPALLRMLNMVHPAMQMALDNAISMNQVIPEEVFLQRYLALLVPSTLMWLGANQSWYQRQERLQKGKNNLIPTQTNEDGEPIAPRPPAFLERAEKKLGENIWAIEAQGHYLKIHTDNGDELIRYRFKDAVAELKHYDGCIVHRSFWVARDAVDNIASKGKGYEITLKSGITIPVSRGAKSTIRKAGWLT